MTGKPAEKAFAGTDSPRVSLPFEIIGDERARARIERMIERAAVSETGRDVLETACKAGYAIGMEFVLGCNGGCSKEKKLIILNPLSKDDELVGVLIHEARHAGQFVRGEYDASDDRRPRKETLKTQIMRTRAVEADAQATAAQALAEIAEAGDFKPLRAFSHANPDIAKAFHKAIYLEDDALQTGAARTAAFTAWYENDAIKTAYDLSYQVEMMRRRAQSGRNIEDTYAESQSAERIVKDLCLSKNGGCYFSLSPSILETAYFINVDRKTAEELNALMKTAAPSHRDHPDNRLPFLPPSSPLKRQTSLSVFNKRFDNAR